MKQNCLKVLCAVIAFSIGNHACAMKQNVKVYEDKSLNGYVLEISGQTEDIIKAIGELLSNKQQPIVGCKISFEIFKGAAGAKALANALDYNTSFLLLNLEYNGIGPDGAAALAKMLKHNTSLTSLNLRYNEIGSIGVLALVDAFLNNTSLTSLNLLFNGIDDTGAEAIAQMLGHTKCLKLLDLGHNRIGDKGIVAIAKVLGLNKSLRELNLAANAMGNSGALAIASALKKNRSLTSIVLGYGGSTGVAGVKAIFSALEQNSSLESLHLCVKSIGYAEAEMLAKVLKYNKSLRKVDLGVSSIEPDGVVAWATMMEDNTILISFKFAMPYSLNVSIRTKIDVALERNRLLNDLLPVISRALLYEQLDPMPMDLIKIITEYAAISSTADLLRVIMDDTVGQYVDAATLQANQATINRIKELHLVVKPQARQMAHPVAASSSASSSSVNTGVSSGSTSSAISGLACSCQCGVSQAAS